METFGEAIDALVTADAAFRRFRIYNFVGDLGEKLAHASLGGQMMPPTSKGYDILHSDLGRIQVKTRKYNFNSRGRLVQETRAVLSNYSRASFDYLFHLVLDESYHPLNAALANASEVFGVTEKNSGKISIEATMSLPSTQDYSRQCSQAFGQLREQLLSEIAS